MLKIIKNNLLKYRVWKGYTQHELAKLIKVSINLIRNIETKGHYPKYTFRKKLCDCFDISPNQLFYNE